MKYLLIIVSLMAVLIAAGCINIENKNTVIVPPSDNDGAINGYVQYTNSDCG